jgi:hypothetical protein
VGTLAPEIAGLGLAVAITSPGSVVTVIALLSMSNGVRRAIAFICGWVLAIGLLAVLVIFVLHGQDFGSRHTTPSRTCGVPKLVSRLQTVLSGARASVLAPHTPAGEGLARWSFHRVRRRGRPANLVTAG